MRDESETEAERKRNATETTAGAAGGVRLRTHRPPGRCTRKALPFIGEIHRLRGLGYSLESIRQALSVAGVSVSKSTVYREVCKAPCPQLTALVAGTTTRAQFAEPVKALPPQPTPARSVQTHAAFPHGSSGEEVARTFMATQVTNPFLRHKEHR